MFHLISLGWLFFRSASMSQVMEMFNAVFFNFALDQRSVFLFYKFLHIIVPLFLVQLAQYRKRDLLFVYHQHWGTKVFLYAFFTYLLLGWGVMKPQEFFYFQF